MRPKNRYFVSTSLVISHRSLIQTALRGQKRKLLAHLTGKLGLAGARDSVSGTHSASFGTGFILRLEFPAVLRCPLATQGLGAGVQKHVPHGSTRSPGEEPLRACDLPACVAGQGRSTRATGIGHAESGQFKTTGRGLGHRNHAGCPHILFLVSKYPACRLSVR